MNKTLLPDFPRLRKDVQKKLMLRLHLTVQQRAPIRALAGSITAHEGCRHSYDQITRGGVQTVTADYQEVRTELRVSLQDVPDLVGEKLLEKIDELADDTARQISQSAYRTIDEVTRKAGTAIHAGGKELDQEMFLEMLSRVDHNFDPRTGEPEMVFMAAPKMVEAMLAKSRQWERDPTFVKRHKEIVARKYEEWRDRESCRKLVD